MDYSIYEPIAESMGTSVEMAIVIFAIIVVWTLIWKGLAMWKSCKKDNYIWFVAFLILNTIGILEILYIFLFSKIDLNKKEVKNKNAKKKGRASKKKGR